MYNMSVFLSFWQQFLRRILQRIWRLNVKLMYYSFSFCLLCYFTFLHHLIFFGPPPLHHPSLENKTFVNQPIFLFKMHISYTKKHCCKIVLFLYLNIQVFWSFLQSLKTLVWEIAGFGFKDQTKLFPNFGSLNQILEKISLK